MNKRRRSSIKVAANYLDRAIDLIRDAKEEEQDALGNMPENLQSSERCEAMEEAIDNLEDAISSIDEAKDHIDRAIA